MAPRRSTRGGRTSRASTQSSGAGIQKNTRSRQAPTRYGQQQDPAHTPRGSESTNGPSSDNDEGDPSTPEYSHSPPSNTRTLSGSPASRNATGPDLDNYLATSDPATRPPSASASERSINMTTMRELLRSHEQEIVDRVVLQLRTQHDPLPTTISSNPLPSNHPPPSIQLAPADPTLTRIAELEGQLAELRATNRHSLPLLQPRPLGMLYPTQTPIAVEGESASGIVDSVESLFPGVERSTLVQIIENRFKPTNIYRLLASEKESAETHRTINIGGVEFEQAERDRKESEYRMSGFFKAWAAYCGILIKLAPYALQGELATALCIYTMNLYDLLEKYTWDGVKAYHFQFHRKRVASGKDIYHPSEWRQLDSQLIASKCFAYPALRPPWPTTVKPPLSQARSANVAPFSHTERRSNFSYQAPPATSAATHSHLPQPPAPQPCHNWNFRECNLPHCRYQHCCLTCGSSHRILHCTLRTSSSSQVPRNSQTGR